METLVVFCGGKGTRLSSITNGKPKFLVDVGNRSFSDYFLGRLEGTDISHIVFLTSEMNRSIEEKLGYTWKGIRLSYVYDRDDTYGTFNALRVAMPRLPEEFLMQYGDTLLEISYQWFWDECMKSRFTPITIAITRDTGNEKANVSVKNDKKIVYSKSKKDHHIKPTFIDYGLAMVNKSELEKMGEILADDIHLETVYWKLSMAGKLGSVVTESPYFEVGNPDSLNLFKSFLSRSPGLLN